MMFLKIVLLSLVFQVAISYLIVYRNINLRPSSLTLGCSKDANFDRGILRITGLDEGADVEISI